jgi:hypothetical protein
MRNTDVEFEALTAVVRTSSILYDTAPYSPLKMNRRIGTTHRLHLQDRTISQARNQHGAGSKLHAGPLLGLLFDPEDGGG